MPGRPAMPTSTSWAIARAKPPSAQTAGGNGLCSVADHLVSPVEPSARISRS